MKLQKLAIHNIASIENAEIDFSKDPLAGSDVFLITGKTGSGKSTILDAICLALYKNTPRLNGTKMQGALDDSGKDVQISDPVQLLRENTGEGYVRLSFLGSNGIPYEAEWSVARAHNKPSGRIQGKKWSLKNLSSGTIFTKDAEIEAEMKQAVNLTFDQFCRTTMLAQGEFTRFLNSKDEDKAEILEMITGADVYSKIGAKVFEKTKEKKEAYDAASAAIEGITQLTEEEKEEKSALIESKKAGIKEAASLRDSCHSKASWLVTQDSLEKKTVSAQTALKAASDATQSEDYTRKKALASAWEETQDVRYCMDTERKENLEAETAAKAISAMAGSYREVLSGEEFLRQRQVEMQRSLSSVEKALALDAPNLTVIEKAQAVEGHLQTIASSDDSIARLNSDIEKVTRNINDVLLPAKDAALNAQDDAKNARDNAQSSLKKAEEDLSDAGLPALREKITRITEEKGSIRIALERIDRHKKTVEEWDKEGDAIKAREKELSSMKEAREGKAGEVEELRINYEVERRVYERESMSNGAEITAIRSKLSVGDICPVCRQEIQSVLPTDEEISARLEPIREKFHDAERLYESGKTQLQELDASIQAEGKQLLERKERHIADGSVEAGRKAVLDALTPLGIETYDRTTGQVLTERMAAIDEELSSLEGAEARGKELETAVQKARAAAEDAGKAYENASQASTEAEKKVSDAKADLTTKTALRDAGIKNRQTAADAVKEIVSGSKWEDIWHSDIRKFGKELSETVTAHNKALTGKQALTEEMKDVSQTVSTVKDLIEELVGLVPEWKGIDSPSAQELPRLEQVARELRDCVIIQKQNIKNAMDDARNAAAKVEAFISAHSEYTRDSIDVLSRHSQEEITALEKSLKDADEALVSAKSVLNVLGAQLTEHASKKPAFEEGETLEVLKVKEEESSAQALSLNADVALLEQELKTDEENSRKVGTLKAKADSLHAEWVKWDRLNSLIGDNTGKKFRKIAQSYVLGSLVAAANRYMRDLTDRYTLKVVPGTFIILLEDAYEGYVTRPASTISGGESFLVSLSLALALSDIGDTLSVDTLFIDEGFGTLSGVPLDNAVNTLKSLRTKGGRHVGIISHVQELQEKIPVQIKVEQNNRTATSTVTVGSE